MAGRKTDREDRLVDDAEKLAASNERLRCLNIVLETIKDNDLMKRVTPAGALQVVAERIKDPSITHIAFNEMLDR